MDRIILKNNNEIISDVLQTQFFVVDSNLTKIDIPSNSKINILFNNELKDKEININVARDCEVTFSIIARDNLDNCKINININKNSHVEGFLADFTKGKEKFNFTANLLEDNAIMNWHLSSLTADIDDKKFDISVNHDVPSTFARMENYGVCKDNGKLLFAGISSIKKGSRGSKTHQSSKIMVFDKQSKGIADPILKIDENDIEASHAAVVGKINDDHLYYLTSRGLSEAEAKELITFGYLKPIINGFIEENLKEEIASLIEGRM